MSASTDDLSIFRLPAAEDSSPAAATHSAVKSVPATASTRTKTTTHWGWRSALQSASQGITTLLLGLLLPLALFGLWWLTADRHWIAEQILPSPSFVWESFTIVWDSGELLGHVVFSAKRVAWSLLIGGSSGFLLGLGMGLSKTLKAYLLPTFNVLSQLPVLGWIPLLIIFVGIEEPLKVSAISIAVVVPVMLSTLHGIANIPVALLDVGRVYRFNAWQVVSRIVLPAAAPALFTGVRQGVMQAWLTVIFVELLSSSEGLGFFMAYSRSLSQIDMVILSMFAIGVVGVLIEFLLRLVESRLQRWRHTAY